MIYKMAEEKKQTEKTGQEAAGQETAKQPEADAAAAEKVFNELVSVSEPFASTIPTIALSVSLTIAFTSIELTSSV